MIDIIREPVTRIKVKDLEAWASAFLGRPESNPWQFCRASGHRGEQSIEYIVTGIGGRPQSALGVLNAACREGLIEPGLVIVDCTISKGVPWILQRRQMDQQDLAAVRHYASMANR